MYLRDCALDKKIIVVKGIDEAANELRKIGNNLNQLTRAVNSGYCYEVDLRETREEVATRYSGRTSINISPSPRRRATKSAIINFSTSAF